MTNRKILYGCQIQNGDLRRVEQEAAVVSRVFTLYTEGLSYQKISDILNGEHIPFSPEAPQWNKQKVKRMLENPRYTGQDGYPVLIEKEQFQAVQELIREKTVSYVPPKDRPALRLKAHLQCGCCGGELHRQFGKHPGQDTLYLKCICCGARINILDSTLLEEVSRQMAEHDNPTGEPYRPSEEVIRLTNAINRGLEHPVGPEEIITLILEGASARYDCCPATTEQDRFDRPAEVDFKRFGWAVSYITITGENTVTVHFKGTGKERSHDTSSIGAAGTDHPGNEKGDHRKRSSAR
jgi:hypothetical protein